MLRRWFTHPIVQLIAASGRQVSKKCGRCSPTNIFDASMTSSNKTRLIPKSLNQCSAFRQLNLSRCLNVFSPSSSSSMKRNSTIHNWKRTYLYSCNKVLSSFLLPQESARGQRVWRSLWKWYLLVAWKRSICRRKKILASRFRQKTQWKRDWPQLKDQL